MIVLIDFANGGLETFVGGLDSDMTSDQTLLIFFESLVDQSVGVQNRALSLLSSKLDYYGKGSLRVLMKEVSQSQGKAQYSIVKSVLDRFRIICLKESKQIMVFKGTHFSFDLTELDQFISSEIEMLGEDQKKMFGEVEKWIQSNLQYPMRDLCFDSRVIPFLNGYYDVRNDVFVARTEDNHEDHEDMMFFYCIPHDYKHPRGPTWIMDDKPDCKMFKKALVQWIDAKVFKENPVTHKFDVRVRGYRKGERKILIDDVFEMIGLCMSLEVGFKKVFMNYGVKDTGKTQFGNIIGHIIGVDNMSFQELYILTERFGSTAIQFKTLNLCGDMTNTSINKTGMFNLYTGGDKEIPAELKGGKKFNFPPSSKFWFNINLFPYVKDFNNDAFFERFILILFPNVFTNECDDFKINYYELITSNPNEIQGIIYESLKGLRRLYERQGFRKEIELNTKHIWNYHSNPYYRFLEDFCELDKKERIEVHEFFDRFSDEIGAGYTMFQLNRGLEKLGIRKREVKVPVINNPKKKISKYFYFGVKWVDNYSSEEKSDVITLDRVLRGPKKKTLKEKMYNLDDIVEEYSKMDEERDYAKEYEQFKEGLK